MPSTFFGLTIATSGLYTYQAALNTTGHNITNTETRGYTKQSIVQKASRPISTSPRYGMVGTGVDVTEIIQNRDSYYDTKYWANCSLYGEYATKEYYMLSTENYFSEVNADGTTQTFTSFFTSLSDLHKAASGHAERTQVAKDGENLTEYLNYVAGSLQKLQNEANTDIKNTADQINSLAKEIASLTKQINTIEMKNVHANDLRDSRALLIDELSTLANVTVSEVSVGDIDSGRTEYTVRLDGRILVNTYDYNTIECVPRDYTVSQCDEEGLYDLRWNDGESFNARSTTLGGKLQALFEFRDGNNAENLKGTMHVGGDMKTVVMSGTNCNDINKLDIPAENGMITIGNQEFEYDYFEVDINPATNEYTYTFHLKDNVDPARVNGNFGQIGDSVDYKGIPYYMNQMNEFVRTFANAFNGIHNQGQGINDYDGVAGVDFFNAKHPVTGDNYNLLGDAGDAGAFTHFTSRPAVGAGGGLVTGSYYDLTAMNVTVSGTILKDPDSIAAKSMSAPPNEDIGIDEAGIVVELMALRDDEKMFKQGTPHDFLRTLTVDVGVNTKKAGSFSSSQKNILNAIETQRMSVSGVDEDEEAMNMVKYKYAYNLSAKLVQIMNQMYDKLINDMV